MEEGLIRNTPDLKEACDALVAGGVAALDTEFVTASSARTWPRSRRWCRILLS